MTIEARLFTVPASTTWDVIGAAHAAVQVLGGKLEGALDRRRPSQKNRKELGNYE